MAIAFQCSCGKAYKVKPELAGKRVKCAACGKVLQVPAAEPQLEELKPIGDDFFAGLPPLQAMPQSPALVGSQLAPISAPLAYAPLAQTSPSGAAPSIAPWVWIVAAAGGFGVLVVAGFMVLATMGGTVHRSQPEPNYEDLTTIAPAPPPMPSVTMGEGLPTGWYEAVSAPGRFRAFFPRPAQLQRPTASPQSSSQDESYVADMGDIGAVVGGSVTLPSPVNPQQEIQRWSRLRALDLAKRNNIRITNEEPRTIKGHYARYYILDGERGGKPLTQHVLFVLTRDRGYEFYWSVNQHQVSRTEVEIFFSGVRLTNADGEVVDGPQIASSQLNQESSAPPVAPSQPQVSAGSALSWQTFRSAQGKYSIEFPGQPQHREDQQNTPQGNLVLHTDFVANASVGGAYMVSYTKTRRRIRNPKADLEKEAPQAVAGVASGASASLVEKRDIAMPGAASKLYVLETSVNGVSIQIQVVFVLTADTFYHVSWTGPKDTVPQSEVTRFITSFRADAK